MLTDGQFRNQNISECLRLTRDDVHDEEEEGRADAPGVGRHDLHDNSEEDREPGLRKQIIQG